MTVNRPQQSGLTNSLTYQESVTTLFAATADLARIAMVATAVEKGF
ncbi:MAG TPA: hypothetical protein VH500_19360 [Nitrososphaeraceae archaeon]